MQKKYIIAVVLTALLWGGFLYYRQAKKGEDGDTHREKMNHKITEMAKKSPRAGLAHIGEALEAYRKAKNEYPPNLMALYPDYIDNKPFLTQIDWYYEPRGIDFYLSKTVVIDNKRMVASMDNSMRPRTEKGVMVAAPTPPPRPQSTKAERPEKQVTISEKERIAMARENFMNALREGRFSVTAVSVPDRDEEQLLAKVMPRFRSIGDEDGPAGLEVELGQRFLVWKGDTGHLGFSNTQYPETSELSIFTYGRWYHVRVPSIEAPPANLVAQKDRKGQHWAEFILSGLDDRHLAWKDQHGTYGFGDSQYPENQELSVFGEGGWVNLETPTRPRDMDATQDPGKGPVRSKTQIASGMARQWLVWKTKNGSLGFGNLQYPGTHIASVYHDDTWIPLEKPPEITDGYPDKTPGEDEKKSKDDIASLFGDRHLVWKDKHGTMGFGNLQYPAKDLSAVYQSEEWIDLKKHRRNAETEKSNKEETEGRKLLSQNDRVINGPYLVWKTHSGTLGFGNLQYPTEQGISHIQLDGSWEKFAN